MCGIAGWLGTLPDSATYASRMAHALHHRGLTLLATWSWPEATLIHTRLSIIDLSPTGAQPMANADGTVWTVFNGEIYNHRELRRQLEARGQVFCDRLSSNQMFSTHWRATMALGRKRSAFTKIGCPVAARKFPSKTGKGMDEPLTELSTPLVA
jgi:hypothetical protein